MQPFLYRYNRFTNSYLINYQDYEFEVEPELFTILQTYYSSIDIRSTLYRLFNKQIFLSELELIDIIHMVEQGNTTKEYFLRSRTFLVLDFKIFNTFLDHKILTWFLFFVFFSFGIEYSNLFSHYLFLPRTNFYLFTNMIMIIPLYFLSRILFTPIHEFGHNFFYYLFTGKSAKFYIQFPGFLYFVGITTTDYLFYVKNPIKRIIISVGGMLFEFLFLILVISLFQSTIDSFYLQILTLRVFLSILFNLNFLSQSTDGHILITDLLGFTTFTETYNDYLKHFINRKFVPCVPVTNKVKFLLWTYTIAGLLFILILVASNLVFLVNIIKIMILPLTQNISLVRSPFQIFLMMLTYLYYLDIAVRIYMKKIVIQKMIAIKTQI